MVDKDGCGDIFFDEFVLWFCIEKGFKNIDDKLRYYRVEKVIEFFRQYDKDDSGIIDRDEFKLLFEKFKVGNCNDLQLDNVL